MGGFSLPDYTGELDGTGEDGQPSRPVILRATRPYLGGEAPYPGGEAEGGGDGGYYDGHQQFQYGAGAPPPPPQQQQPQPQPQPQQYHGYGHGGAGMAHALVPAHAPAACAPSPGIPAMQPLLPSRGASPMPAPTTSCCSAVPASACVPTSARQAPASARQVRCASPMPSLPMQPYSHPYAGATPGSTAVDLPGGGVVQICESADGSVEYQLSVRGSPSPAPR